VNDNAPTFATSSVVRELLESSPVGTALTVDSATDRDTTQFGVSRYQLVPVDEPAASHFELKVRHFPVDLGGPIYKISYDKLRKNLE